MKPQELRLVVERTAVALRNLEVPFHITGGLASSYYGEPRLTQDVDFVVRLDVGLGRRLAEALDAEFLIEVNSVEDAVRCRGMFQALHRSMLIKADFHVGERISGELERSVVVPLFASSSGSGREVARVAGIFWGCSLTRLPWTSSLFVSERGNWVAASFLRRSRVRPGASEGVCRHADTCS